MQVSELGTRELRRRLTHAGLCLQTGPFRTRIHSRIPAVADGIAFQYRDFPVVPADSFCDFRCHLRAPRTLRRFHRPQVLFLADGRSIFKPLAYHQAFPMLEWGMNWCVANQTPEHLVFHAAALARGERALILPAPPGAGKSTLCAALAQRGWRLLTDESTLLDPASGSVCGPARPVSLKNASIEVLRRFAPEAVIGPACHDTIKGTVAHMRPPEGSALAAGRPARPAWLVFPRYQPGAETRLTPRHPAEAFMEMASQAFNYANLGRTAFHATADLIDQVEAYDFVYSRLEEAIDCFDALAD